MHTNHRAWKCLIVAAMLAFLASGAGFAARAQDALARTSAVVPSDVVTFIQITDAHMGTRAPYEPNKDAWERNLNQVIQQANHIFRPAAIVHTGDSVTLSDQASYSVYTDFISQAQMPVMSVPGNHDYGPIEFFEDYVGRQNNIVDAGSLCLISLDSLNINYPWLETQLRQNAPEKRIVLLAHYPLHGPDEHPDLRLSDANRTRIAALMKRYGVAGWANGHIHVDYEQVEPISEAVDFSTAPIGERGSFRLFAYDNGVLSSISVPVTHPWPLVLITYPQRHLSGLGASVPSEVRALVYSDAPVQQVEYRAGNAPPVSMSYAGQNLWTAPWNASFSADTPLTMTVSATDTRQRTSTSSIQVLAGAHNTPGAVTLLEPSTGTIVTSTLVVSGLAEDQDGLRTARVYVDGALAVEIPLQGTTAPFHWTWNAAEAQNGEHTVQIALGDQRSQWTRTPPVTFAVTGSTADNPPAVSLLSPLSGQVGGTIELRALASDDRGLSRISFQYRKIHEDIWQPIRTIELPEDGGTDPPPQSGQYSASLQTYALPNGDYELCVRAWDDATYPQENSDKVTIRVNNVTPMPPVRTSGTIASAWSDHYQVNGTTDQHLDRIFFGLPFVAGLRFSGLQIPRGAIINSAALTVVNVSYTGEVAVRIQGEASSYPGLYLQTTLSARPTTTASTIWRVPNSGVLGTSPDLGPVIQEIVNRPDWQPDSRLGLLVTPIGPGSRSIHSYESDRFRAARLDVTYTLSSSLGWPVADGLNVEQPLDTEEIHYLIAHYSDPDGWSDITDALLLIGDQDVAPVGTELRFESTTNRLFIKNSGNDSWDGGVPPGTPTTLGGQVRLHVANTVAIRSGNGMTVYWAISFGPTARGTRGLYARCLDKRGLETGWVYQDTCDVQTRR